MKNILLPILGVAIFITFVGVLTQRLSSRQISSKQISVGDAKIKVEVAKTPQERQKGLSGRTTLDAESGMLFVFDQRGVFPSFWMKDMVIALDIIWIADGKILKIDKNARPPAPATPDNKLILYYPDKPIDYVLEVNAGFSDKNNIKVGDSVDLSSI